MGVEAVDPLHETVLESHEIHRGRLLQVRDDLVRLGDGRVAHREVVEHPGAVCVVAIDDEGRIGLVRQWRHPVRRALWELPAGTRDVAGEAPQETAARELSEELGVAAREWRHLATWPLAPGYSSELMHFFLATGISDRPGTADADELLERGWYHAPALRDLIGEGDVDVKTVAGLAAAGFEVARRG